MGGIGTTENKRSHSINRQAWSGRGEQSSGLVERQIKAME